MKSAVLITSVVMGLAACSKSNDKTITGKDPKTGESVDVSVNKSDTGDMTFKSKEGTVVINSGADAKLPAGVDVYPGAEVKSSIIGNGKDGSGAMLSMTTTEEPAKVLAFYKSKFAAKGWKISMETTMPTGGLIAAGGENNGPGAMVTVNAEKGQTVISVISGTK